MFFLVLHTQHMDTQMRSCSLAIASADADSATHCLLLTEAREHEEVATPPVYKSRYHANKGVIRVKAPLSEGRSNTKKAPQLTNTYLLRMKVATNKGILQRIVCCE